MQRITLFTIAPFTLIAAPVMAEPGVKMLVSSVSPGERPDSLIVEITLLNAGPQATPDAGPERIAAFAMVEGRRIPVMLNRLLPSAAPSARKAQPLAAGGFIQMQYRLDWRAPEDRRKMAVLSLDPSGTSGYAFTVPDGITPDSRLTFAGRDTTPAPEHPVPSMPDTNAAPAAKPDHGNAYLGNLSSYAPIYAVYGPGTNSDGRIQISFKYQLFGQAGAVGRGNPLLNGIHFAYTQRMFWDLGAASSPFRNIDYMPELFYLMPATPVGKAIALGAQAGFRHESNGRSGPASRSLNTIYVQPIATMPLGKYTLSVGPRLLVYAGDLSGNPDVKRYRGNSSLFAEIGEDDGLRLTTNSRLNFSTGKGALDAELSYPLDRIVDTGLNLYVFGQGFAGYGENLLDYNRKINRLRIGIGIVR
jgi:outer membrane phospholipase A